MKKFNIWLAIFVLCFSCNNGNVSGTKDSKEEILNQISQGAAILVDVRTPEEYNEGHLKNSVNVNYKSKSFTDSITQLPRDKNIYLYCKSGNRSQKSKDTLLHYGFNQVYNLGGFEDLKSSDFPAIQ